MTKIILSLISYLNTKPFIYGIENSDFLSKNTVSEFDYPSACARKLQTGQAHIGIVPVASIPSIPHAEIITDFCIAADYAMPSVLLCSQVPLEEISTVYLDYQSMTSVTLTRILMEERWKIQPTIVQSAPGYEESIKGNTAGVIIGDRALLKAKKFKHTTDLAREWNLMTGKPFVFACWVSSAKLSASFFHEFNSALKYGIDNIEKVAALEQIKEQNANINVLKYLKQDLAYDFSSGKKEALALFLDKIKKRNLPVV